MIQKSLLILLGLVFLLPLSGQTTLGVKTHYGTAWQEYGELPINGFDQRIDGYGVSAELSLSLSNKIRLNISPGYVRRGAACEPGFISLNPFIGAQDATLYSNYIELPVVLQLEWPVAEKFSIVTKLGGGAAYMLSGYREVLFFDLTQPMERQDLDFDNESTLNRFDFGLHGGLGVNYNFGPAKLQLLGNYYHGLLDVTDTNTSQNRALGIELGYLAVIGE